MKGRSIIVGAILIIIVTFLVLILNKLLNLDKKFDKSFTVSRYSYKPYDSKFFFDELKQNAGGGFKENNVSFELTGLGLGETVNTTYMIVSPNFYPKSLAINHLKAFASKGNNVFICAFGFTTELIDSLYNSTRVNKMNGAFPPFLAENRWSIKWNEEDSTQTQYHLWGHKPVTAILDSIYLPGNDLITDIDTLITDDKNNVQLLEIECGYGHIFLCNNPILVSNYFLLYQDNYTLFNKIADKINLAENNIIWDDYYRKVNSADDASSTDIGKSEVFRVIFENPPLVWAFYTFLIGIGLFLLIYYRRIQQPIPIYSTPKNNSEAYITVVSGLYWQQQNHKSIADKVITQFFEYLVHNFHIHAKDFQESELEKISLKTGRSLQDIHEIFDEISLIKSQEEITKQSLMNLYQRINSFYKA
ncbi:DUF4350 domain-containing protein [Emticicia sp. BO119]|uniref:DUF4350 domain-containing protein n=1 Tax=Emticicia sp. BO119 TaxID=2757768 RepID=UPI0015F0E280|nr:hypothetical protein [Emticicia sp. BO119]MBA4852642.1 hypothetical protein [Emticicia sp. BO119]